MSGGILFCLDCFFVGNIVFGCLEASIDVTMSGWFALVFGEFCLRIWRYRVLLFRRVKIRVWKWRVDRRVCRKLELQHRRSR